MNRQAVSNAQHQLSVLTISGEPTKLTIGGDKGITGGLVRQTAFKGHFQLHLIALTVVFEAACNGHPQLLILIVAAVLVKTVLVVSEAAANGHDHHLPVMNMTGDHRHMTVFLKGVTGKLLRGVASNGHQRLQTPTVVAVAVAVVRDTASNSHQQLPVMTKTGDRAQMATSLKEITERLACLYILYEYHDVVEVDDMHDYDA